MGHEEEEPIESRQHFRENLGKEDEVHELQVGSRLGTQCITHYPIYRSSWSTPKTNLRPVHVCLQHETKPTPEAEIHSSSPIPAVAWHLQQPGTGPQPGACSDQRLDPTRPSHASTSGCAMCHTWSKRFPWLTWLKWLGSAAQNVVPQLGKLSY